MTSLTFDTQRVLSYLLVAALWGITNPLLKRAATSSSNLSQNESLLGSLTSLLVDCNKLIPFLFNQLGSLTFYYLLANEPVTVASPICNSLTFAFTAISAFCMGERPQSPTFLACGVLLVLVGTCISFS